jgi:hypothetical protein
LARLCGWKVYYTFDSRRSTAGYPDLTLLKPICGNQPARLVFAELKSHKGKLTAEQTEWLKLLGEVQGIEVHCWKPCHWNQIVEILKRP